MIRFKHKCGKAAGILWDSDFSSRLQGPDLSLRAAVFSKRKFVLKIFSSSVLYHDNCFY